MLPMYKNKNTTAVAKSRRKTRLALIEYKGGCCARCGYDKCSSALEFHHIDPSKKDFGIGDGNSRALKKLMKEAEKCVLLCANCHRELHYGIWNIKEIIAC